MATHHDAADASVILPGPRRFFTLLARAFTLRCPNCGKRGIARSWFKMNDRCPHCGIKTEREGEDYFIGSMMFNLVLSEMCFAVGLLAYLVAVWPRVNWDRLEVVAPAMMAAAPFVLFPFSKLVWLGVDLIFRPAHPDEMR